MRGIVLALLALIIVRADTTFTPDVLVQNARLADNPGPLLWRAAEQGDARAQAILVDIARAAKQRYWLQRLVRKDNARAAWALYEMSDPATEQPELMRLAALGDVAEAQLSYAMSKDDPDFREKWLKKSAQQGLVSAQAALADWYLLYEQPQKAEPWLKLTANVDSQSAYKYGRLLWDSGKQKLGKEYLSRAAAQGNETAIELLDIIERYAVAAPADTEMRSWPVSCRQRIALVADSLSTIQRADKLYRDFNSDQRLTELPLCLTRPVWLPKDTVSCDENWRQSQRLGCDIRPLAPVIEQSGASHIVMIARQGKANINNGAMFLDIGDTYSVFVHELAHFAGFADEYPLSATAARRVCKAATKTVNESPNLIFDGRITYAPMQVLERWQQLQPGQGIWPAKTCSMIDTAAYKPASQITFMEHHDTGVIPPLYLKLWRQQIEDRNRQRPVSMNLFQSFHAHGQTAEASVWLGRYQQAIAEKPAPPTATANALPRP